MPNIRKYSAVSYQLCGTASKPVPGYGNSYRKLSAISYQLSAISLWLRSQRRSLCHPT
ncbi:hypothetical protein [Moorena sp. SIO2C4]|uniref:hypothetical protein n=1 Tax=Moorena sp. SIO2C4 TaxID=2607824 RepID=UPI00257F9FE9|nr:hypothetical protein [Moorena sp. SIO2C4]